MADGTLSHLVVRALLKRKNKKNQPPLCRTNKRHRQRITAGIKRWSRRSGCQRSMATAPPLLGCETEQQRRKGEASLLPRPRAPPQRPRLDPPPRRRPSLPPRLPSSSITSGTRLEGPPRARGKRRRTFDFWGETERETRRRERKKERLSLFQIFKPHKNHKTPRRTGLRLPPRRIPLVRPSLALAFRGTGF